MHELAPVRPIDLGDLIQEIRDRAIVLGWLDPTPPRHITNPQLERFLFRLVAGSADDAAVAIARQSFAASLYTSTWTWAIAVLPTPGLLALRNALVQQSTTVFERPEDVDARVFRAPAQLVSQLSDRPD